MFGHPRHACASPRVAITVVAALLTCYGCSRRDNYSDPDGPRYAGDYAPQSETIPETLRIVTFNIALGRDLEGAEGELVGHPDLKDADVVMLQEMSPEGVDRLARNLAYNYIYYPASRSDDGGFGNAVMARWPIIDDHKLILPHRNPTNDRQRNAVSATVETPRATLLTYSVHVDTPWLGPRGRLDQAGAIIDDAAGSPFPTVVAGDFNSSDPGAVSSTTELYATAGYSWATRDIEATVSAGLDRRLDLVFVRELTPLQSGAVPTSASDHHAVWALLGFGSAP